MRPRRNAAAEARRRSGRPRRLRRRPGRQAPRPRRPASFSPYALSSAMGRLSVSPGERPGTHRNIDSPEPGLDKVYSYNSFALAPGRSLRLEVEGVEEPGSRRAVSMEVERPSKPLASFPVRVAAAGDVRHLLEQAVRIGDERAREPLVVRLEVEMSRPPVLVQIGEATDQRPAYEEEV